MNDKDQAAIDHVASVSKHPHAAMIVKWLITGWEVRAKMSEAIIEAPHWISNVSYELIEPKPAKPAYRVYVSKISGQTFSRNSAEDGTRDNSLTPSSEWLSDDWIEYDYPTPEKRWPTPLVERIAAIDIKSAEWIVDNWDDLVDGNYARGSSNIKNDSLTQAFAWDMTPQGRGYWDSINDRM